MTRQLPIVFGQTDYLQQLGTTGGSIKDYGCYVTTMATLARACGKETDPVELNKLYIQKGLYKDGSLMYDNNLTQVFSDIVYQQTINFTPEKPFDIEQLRELMKDPSTWVIIKIAVPAPYNTHFVLCAGVNGVIHIADPMTKHIDDFSTRYGDPKQTILKLVIYKGAPLILNGDDSLRAERDINWNTAAEIAAAFGIVATPDDKPGMVAEAKEKANSYNQQIASLTLQLSEVNKKYETEQRTNLDLKREIEEIHKQDRNYGQEALDAQHKVTELQNGVAEIAKDTGVPFNPEDSKKVIEEVKAKVKAFIEESKKTEFPQIKQLEGIVKRLVSMGINTYLAGKGIEPVDTKHDPGLEEKVKVYLDGVRNELMTQVPAAEPLLQEAIKTNETIVKKFVKLFVKV